VRLSGESHRRLRWAARITPMGAVAAALIYSLIVWFAISEPSFPVASVLVGGTFAISAMFVGVAIIAWEWSLVGGLCVVAAGGLGMSGILSTNYSGGAIAPFMVFCAIYIIGGILHLIRAYLIRRH
jgi:hypothetical protein